MWGLEDTRGQGILGPSFPKFFNAKLISGELFLERMRWLQLLIIYANQYGKNPNQESRWCYV